MKKNYILAFALSMGILGLWEYFYVRPRRQAAVAPAAVSVPTAQASASSATAASASPDKEANVVLEFGANRITFNRYGAGISQWEIQENEKSGRWVAIVPRKEGAPLTTFPEVAFDLRREDNSVVFTGRRADGLKIEKTYRIDPAGHLHNILLKLENKGKSPLEADYTLGWGPGIEAGDESGEKNRNTAGAQRALGFEPPRLSKFKPSTQNGAYDWWGVDGNYFLAAFINPDKKPLTLVVEEDEPYFSVHKVARFSLAPGATVEDGMPFFVGPKGYEYLKSLKLGLERSVDFGFFAPIGRLIHKFLRVAHRMTNNYGWAIIVMTFVIQAMVLPLTIKSFQHGQKMKTIQPQLKRLQEQYRNDPRRLNTEMLSMYQRHGLRFMGMEGCFPILIQLPVFWALFSTLRSTYELRHAPWVSWVKDLSAHDPLYVLPVLMGAGMFFQQKMSTATLDPAQQKMMYMMPVIFTFFFLKMPAGLVLYWLTSSIINIAVQLVLLKRAAALEASK